MARPWKKIALAYLLSQSLPIIDSFTSTHPSSSRKSFLHHPSHLPAPLNVATDPSISTDSSSTTENDSKPHPSPKFFSSPPPFKKILAANRAEIAVRIMRAATELNMSTVGIYGHEDRYSQHRWQGDQTFPLSKAPEASPISAYLDMNQIIDIAKEADVEAIHPGYGFLSESPEFAAACAKAGITFVGPTIENLERFSDKTSAREAAIAAGVPVVPGSSALTNEEDVVAFCEENGFPVILKASMGGGGKGMRIVRKAEDLVPLWRAASSEALASFGDGSVFVERFVESPRHIEVQILGDGTGNVIHLWERDCSIQRRHQKVIEMAPAWSLPDELRAELHEYATRLTSQAKYKNAGTVEFLIDQEMRPYFIEVNPRIQVEHTVTEEVTGIDLVQAQFKIAGGATLDQLGFKQEDISARGVAIQCRITTENAERDFSPDTGTLSLYRHSAGAGIRMDGVGYSGLVVTPFYDSMLVKYTARGSNFESAVRRMTRALQECRIRGVNTNIPFLLNVLTHPTFQTGIVTTGFIDENPELKKVTSSRWGFANNDQRDMKKVFIGEGLLRYLANLAVNGHPVELGADETKLKKVHDDVILAAHPKVTRIPKTPTPLAEKPGGNRRILVEEGNEAYAKYVRAQKGVMITDTTWRDAHQSLLATRMRTVDLLRCADFTNQALGANAFSVEMWGGATFDVSMRFLHECPWKRLRRLRAAAPDVPFQMLLRGANAVGYTNYPDNVVYRFCAKAKENGIDIFRVFDALNYEENLKVGVEAAKAAGGFVEATMAYTGDVTKGEGKYTLDYYRDLAQKMVEWGAHSIAVKDMAGLLTPPATRMLVGALREDHPDVPIHVHTHDTPGLGVASMIAAAEAGADVVDCATDAMSGLTSQPSIGAIVANFKGTEMDTGLDTSLLTPLNAYWESVRDLYLPFESGQLSGSSDVYQNEIPGGQYTNLLFQSKQLGLAGKWTEIKSKYAEANQLLGDIPKVTPSSKVVGDLAQFMVAQNLSSENVLAQADKLAFPDSVVQYLRGEIGVPPGGFPEPLRSTVLKARDLKPVEGRPGASLEDYDFDAAKESLMNIYGTDISDEDVLSHALYPSVFENWKEYQEIYGDVSRLPTHLFLAPLNVGDEVELDRGFGKSFLVKLVSVEDKPDQDGTKKVTFAVNGETWYVKITDRSAAAKGAVKEKASGKPGAVGAPMSGVVVGVNVDVGDEVSEGEPVAVLSAMKMETSILATGSGVVERILVNVGDSVDGDDLLVVIKK